MATVCFSIVLSSATTLHAKLVRLFRQVTKDVDVGGKRHWTPMNFDTLISP
jgi:hypothetical protein